MRSIRLLCVKSHRLKKNAVWIFVSPVMSSKKSWEIIKLRKNDFNPKIIDECTKNPVILWQSPVFFTHTKLVFWCQKPTPKHKTIIDFVHAAACFCLWSSSTFSSPQFRDRNPVQHTGFPTHPWGKTTQVSGQSKLPVRIVIRYAWIKLWTSFPIRSLGMRESAGGVGPLPARNYPP